MTNVSAVQAFPSWQVVLVDLRCHGESARLPTRPDGPHDLDSAAGDVLRLLGRLKLFPEARPLNN
jgi:pimeloyl-ACP methyl ester carboxylesterase